MAVPRKDRERALLDDTLPFLRLLARLHADAGGVTEVRLLGAAGVFAARIGPEQVDELVANLRPVTDAPRTSIPRKDHPRTGESNVYFCTGAVRPDPEWPPSATIRRVRRTAKDDDIVASPLVVIDVDPERSPKGRAATDGEKAEALTVAETIRAELAAKGVATALADSGNGYHLLALQAGTVGAEAAASAAEVMRRVLAGLDARFSTPGAKVDIATWNRSRLMKLYGTVSVKGDDLPETPHRLSRLDVTTLPEPADVLGVIVPRAPAPEAPKSTPPPKQGRASRGSASPELRSWRERALARLDLHAVYGEWLTGKDRGNGWLECRDPASSSGDRHPSAGVADGTGKAERGRFKSFRDGRAISVFDFLVERGRCADVAAALRFVADLAGEPLPSRRGRGQPEALDAFAERWAAAEDDAARGRALDEALRLAVRLPTVEQETALDAIRTDSGLSRAAVRAAVAEARKAARREDKQARPRPAPPRPETPVVEYVVNGDTLEALFDKLLAVILPTERFFRRGADMVYVRKERGPIVLDDHNLPGVLSAYLELAFARDTEEGREFERYDALPISLARAFLSSPLVSSRLPELLSYVRSPVFDPGWRFIARFGYHRESRIFYDGPTITPCQGTRALTAALGGFHWKADADRVNFLGALLTALTMPLWGRGHPFLAINGNKPGVGKTTLARVLAAVAEGAEPPTVSFIANEEEMEKQLATRVDAGDRVIIVDNAKSNAPITSSVLERSITAPRLTFRRLGSNTEISRPQNDVLFVLTMNMTQLGPDLRRRALPVNLELSGNARRAEYAADDPIGEALAARNDLLAELAGMVTAWNDAGQPIPDDAARHSTGAAWARRIDAILRHAGFRGFLSNQAESEHAFDADYDVLREVCALHHAEGLMPCMEWAGLLLNGPLSDRLHDRRGQPKSPASQRTTVGILFGHYVDETFEIDEGTFALREVVDRKGQPPIYGFERLS